MADTASRSAAGGTSGVCAGLCCSPLQRPRQDFWQGSSGPAGRLWVLLSRGRGDLGAIAKVSLIMGTSGPTPSAQYGLLAFPTSCPSPIWGSGHHSQHGGRLRLTGPDARRAAHDHHRHPCCSAHLVIKMVGIVLMLLGPGRGCWAASSWRRAHRHRLPHHLRRGPAAVRGAWARVASSAPGAVLLSIRSSAGLRFTRWSPRP